MRVTALFSREHALKIRYIMVVPSWPGNYNNRHLLLSRSPAQSDEFWFTKVQVVVTNRTAILAALVASCYNLHRENNYSGDLSRLCPYHPKGDFLSVVFVRW